MMEKNKGKKSRHTFLLTKNLVKYFSKPVTYVSYSVIFGLSFLTMQRSSLYRSKSYTNTS